MRFHFNIKIDELAKSHLYLQTVIPAHAGIQ